jgi:hypothetical protein
VSVNNQELELTVNFMLCRTRVSDYSRWKAVFDSHADAHRQAGLGLMDLWRSVEEPNNVFFLFSVASRELAEEFVNSPESAKAGEDSGVVDGEYHFVEKVPGYPTKP